MWQWGGPKAYLGGSEHKQVVLVWQHRGRQPGPDGVKPCEGHGRWSDDQQGPVFVVASSKANGLHSPTEHTLSGQTTRVVSYKEHCLSIGQFVPESCDRLANSRNNS